MSENKEVYYLGALQIEDRLHKTGFKVRFQIWGAERTVGKQISNHGAIKLSVEHMYPAFELMRRRVICEQFTETEHLIQPLWELMKLAGEI